MLDIIKGVVPTCMALWTVFVIFLAVLYQHWWRRPTGFPPGPRGIPVLGVMPFLDKFPEKIFKNWSLEKYGPVMSVRLGTSDVVILNTAESIAEAFTNQGSLTSGRPQTVLRQNTKNMGVIFKDYSPKFKAFKKWVLRSLSEHGFAKKGMEDRITEEADCFTEYLKGKVGKPVDLKYKHNQQLDLYVLTCNVICRIVCGRRYEFDDQKHLKYLETMQLIFGDPSDAPKIILIDYFPVLKKIPAFGAVNTRLNQRLNVVQGFAQSNIKEHRETFDKNYLRDFIDTFINEMKFETENVRDYFTDDELVEVIRDFLIAGSETTSNSLLWCFLILIHHPEHAKTIAKEIDAAVGTNETPSTMLREKMPFTCAFIQESMRYRTNVPMGSPHYCQKDTKINGYSIPKGTTIFPNLWGVHNDSVTWPNPSQFDPYRHIDDKGKYRNSSKVIPFSIGPRSCLGEVLAMQEMFVFLTAILQKYEIDSVPGEPLPSVVGINSLTCTPANFKLVLKER